MSRAPPSHLANPDFSPGALGGCLRKGFLSSERGRTQPGSLVATPPNHPEGRGRPLVPGALWKPDFTQPHHVSADPAYDQPRHSLVLHGV